MAESHKIRIEVDRYGHGHLFVDGVDISSAVLGFTLECVSGKTPSLSVRFGGEVTINASAIVDTTSR